MIRATHKRRRDSNTIYSSRIVSTNADFFSVSSLTLTLEADSTDKFVYECAGLVIEIVADKTLTVTDDAHNFVYIDQSGTMGRSALPCHYSTTAPASPATDQHWFDIGHDKMQRWTGTAWEDQRRIFIGYVRADSGAINARYACEPLNLTPEKRFSTLGDGSGGFLDISSGTTTLDGFNMYQAVVVRGTAIIAHTAATTTALSVYAQGPIVMLSSTPVNLNGLGRIGGVDTDFNAGAAGSGNAEGGGGGSGGGGTSAGGNGGARQQMTAAVGNAAAGGAALGGAGVNGNASLSSLGPFTMFFRYPYGNGGGSGGGTAAAAGGDGGKGGGALQMVASVIAISSASTLSAVGNDGAVGPAASRGGGGGGGGGTFTFFYGNLFNSGTFNVAGGTGGASGGAGSGAGGNGGTGRASTFRAIG